MQNRAFWRAIHSLAHPISLGAAILLLHNDHYLRHNFPSWLTGKLGDFSWLIFAPFICATVIAWIVPNYLPQQEKWVAGISFGFIGLWFATAKTIPFIHEITLDVLEKIVGWRGTLRLDVTDLFTLPALLIGWYVWRNAPNMPLKLAPRAWVILALGLVGTLASTDPYYPQSNRGIECIDQDDSILKAVVTVGSYNPSQENYDVFTSTDGGLHWNLEQFRYDNDPNNYTTLPTEDQAKFACLEQVSQVVDPTNSQIQYRFQSGESIEKSTDGGQTWSVVYKFSYFDEEVRAYYYQKRFPCPYGWCSEQIIKPGPLDVIYQEATGNVVFAMGWDGVLVHTPDEDWHWVRLDKYYLEDIHRTDKIRDILFFKSWMAGALGFLVLTTGTAYVHYSGRFRYSLLFIGWIGWIYLVISYTLSTRSYFAYLYYDIPFISLPLLVCLAVPMSLLAIIELLGHDYRLLLLFLALGFEAAILYLFPYILWTQGTIPPYKTASLFAAILVIANLLAIYTFVKHLRLRHPEWLPEEDDEILVEA